MKNKVKPQDNIDFAKNLIGKSMDDRIKAAVKSMGWEGLGLDKNATIKDLLERIKKHETNEELLHRQFNLLDCRRQYAEDNARKWMMFAMGTWLGVFGAGVFYWFV